MSGGLPGFPDRQREEETVWDGGKSLSQHNIIASYSSTGSPFTGPLSGGIPDTGGDDGGGWPQGCPTWRRESDLPS